MSTSLESILVSVAKLKAEHGEPVIGLAMTRDTYRAIRKDTTHTCVPSYDQQRSEVIFGLRVFIKAEGSPEPLFATPSDDEEGR